MKRRNKDARKTIEQKRNRITKRIDGKLQAYTNYGQSIFYVCEAVMILVAKMYTVELILYPEKTSGALEDNSKIYFIREIIDQNSALHD